ncbi:ATP-binding protein [Paraburkholderia sp. CNPSo 3272]|uniref:hybrid sensor histidine kinase/response regulator n=1 Tax=Paraburkholderia sp. CNPSo 3272 TaxID=2940931 RepID=UPI0020B6A448|nr:ATP-binding protein [Paraburkholderia sp. CNPSo 3272]MCP3727732.1 ATP-binding protein [Paraburkholderia sp. CNPSo 3272]
MKTTDVLTAGSSSNAGHFVHFYENEAPLIRRVAEFVEEGLAAGGSAILIATQPHLAALRTRLSRHSDCADPAAPESTLFMLDAQTTLAGLCVDGWPDERLFDSTVGTLVARAARRGGPVHAFGEMVALLSAQGRHDAALRLEHLWNGLGARYRFSLMCAYPQRLFPTGDETAVFRHICDAHARVLPDDIFTAASPAEAFRHAALWRQKAGALEAEILRRERAERQRDDMLMNSPVATALLTGPDHRFRLANLAYTSLASRDNLVGCRYADMFPGDHEVAQALRRAFERGEPVVIDEHRRHGAAGAGRVFTVHVKPLHPESGQAVDSLILTAVDVTEHVRARERLERLHAERATLVADLEQASRVKDEFLAMLGHELRNPLAPIVTALQLMRLHGETASSREQSILERQVEHLVRLVDDLLDVSRITRGDVELKKEAVNLREVITKAVEMASPLFEQRGHRLEVDTGSGITCEADPVRLAQVISNLLTNAARYTDAPGEISVRATCVGQRVQIRVRDNGMGIGRDSLAQIFLPFYRGKEADGRGAGGLGLGLALAKNLVELHGGSVRATSDGPGRGSEFTVELPRGNVERLPADAKAGTAAVTVAAGRRVLVVDDNADAAIALAEWLRIHGHVVEALHDPVAALQCAASFDPDVVVLDIGLPGMDGYELCRQLRTLLDSRSRTYVALTGYGQDGDRERSRAAGFERHFVKPLQPPLLLDIVLSAPAPAGRERT